MGRALYRLDMNMVRCRFPNGIKRAIQLTPRRMLARSVAADMTRKGIPFQNYERLAAGTDHRDVDLLVEQMESIWKLRGKLKL